MPELFIKERDKEVRKINLNEGSLKIGRAKDNDIVILDELVSSHHLRLSFKDNQCQITDLDSTNGTFINELLITEKTLKSGDEVRIGKTILLFMEEEIEDVLKRFHSSVKILPREDYGRSRVNLAIQAGKTQFGYPEFGPSDFELLKRTHQNLSTVYEVSNIINSIFELDKLLDKILELVFGVIKADRGFIGLIDEETGNLIPKASRRIRKEDEAEIRVSRNIIDQVLREEKSVLSSDALTDSRFKDKESVIQQQIRSAMCIPLKGKEKILGIIHVDTELSTGAFSKDDLELLTAVGNQAAIAIENMRLYEENLKAERLAGIGQAIAGLSHYAKNILTGLRGGASIVETALKEGNQIVLKKGWEIVKNSANKISELILDMLSYSKERKPDYKLHSVNNLVKEVLSLLRVRAEENGVELKDDLDDSLGEILIDPQGIHRCLLNLVSNSLEAMDKPGGEVKVTTTKGQPEIGQVLIKVQDTGCGIPGHELKNIFNPFYSTKGAKGTGLGLAITQKIIKEHEGKIWVESELREGTAFHINLPIKE